MAKKRTTRKAAAPTPAPRPPRYLQRDGVGMIDPEKAYTTWALARDLGFRQARTLEAILDEREILPADLGGGVRLIPGHVVVEVLTREMKWPGKDA